ncbi:MAG: hypothetical protein KC944_24340, partial [Candidatus Omnitrophica bacterium]|nr:hypothetical protein [Candidatus Omnitrophota bacterium]
HAGYATVRDAATQDEIRDGIRDLFVALAHEWLKATGRASTTEEISMVLGQLQELIASGFHMAINGNYQEALNQWDSAEVETGEDPYVNYSRDIARQLIAEPRTFKDQVEPILDKDFDTALECLTALRKCERPETGDWDRLAKAISAVSE